MTTQFDSVQQENIKDEIKRGALSALHECLQVDENKSGTVEHWSVGWEDGGKGRYWIGKPLMPAASLLYITRTGVEDLSLPARQFAEAGYLFQGLSWRDLTEDRHRYTLFSGQAETDLFIKAAALALSIDQRSERGSLPSYVIGSSNGGIVASLVNETVSDPFSGLIYYLSGGGFTQGINSRTGRLKDFPDFGRALDPLYTDTQRNRAYALITVNDVFFPFKETYSWLWQRTKGNLYVIPNSNHQDPQIDRWSLFMRLVDQWDRLPERKPPRIIRKAAGKRNFTVTAEWDQVRGLTGRYARGDNPTYSYFFESHLVANFEEKPFMYLLSGECSVTGLPVSYFTTVSASPADMD